MKKKKQTETETKIKNADKHIKAKSFLSQGLPGGMLLTMKSPLPLLAAPIVVPTRTIFAPGKGLPSAESVTFPVSVEF